MENKLSKQAYGGVKGQEYVPYVSGGGSGTHPVVMVAGILLAILFAASTAYSGMKSGLTVAAGIPGAIIGSGIITALARQKGILGKNLLQGMSSGGESVASGAIFVLPAVLLIGAKFSFLEGFLVGAAGVLFGIGVTTLVHNYLIVEEHGTLLYPEAMAISETLVASEGAGESLKYMGIGFGIGGLLTVMSSAFLNLTNNVISLINERFYKWKFEMEINPMLLGIGFIVGLDISLTMFAGSLLANFAVLPLIGYFASLASDTATVWNNPAVKLNEMTVGNIGGSYLRYIGAGMMLSGGLIGAVRLIPTIISSVRNTLKAGAVGSESKLSNFVLLAGIGLMLLAGLLISGGHLGLGLGATALSLFLTFLFVIVSGRLAGTVGCSNLPVSGMTIASIVLVTLLFIASGLTDQTGNRMLLLFGAFIVTAIAIAGGYSQSQKVTFIIGGNKTEMLQHFVIAALIGVAVVVGVILLLSDQLALTGDRVPFALPQANLISTLTNGIMTGQLPWGLILVGAAMGVVMFLLGLPIMTVAIGFYLPIATTSIILVGALLRVVVEKLSRTEAEKDARVSHGISLSSGLVAGSSILGLLGILLQVTGVVGGTGPSGFTASNGMAAVLLGLLLIAVALPLLRRRD